MTSQDAAPTAIDLFCGAGGLSLGLRWAGFNVVAGVELDAATCATYRANHPSTVLLTKDVRDISGKEILNATGLQSVDLLAGCPPCQGFSKLTDKYKRHDPRNDLVLEMARLVEELQPQTVMMENVPGLATRGASLLETFLDRLRRAGYVTNSKVLQLADFGVPQSRRRLVVLAGKRLSVPMPARTHSWRGNDDKLRPWLTLRDAIKRTGRPVTLSRALNTGGPRTHEWHVVRDLKPLSLERYKALRAGNNRGALPRRLRPECHKDDDSAFRNAYARMTWNQTPPTMTSGCTTPCKGRFGHPSRNNTISVKEAALIQTFPRSYRLETDRMDLACSLVGNALPPKFARQAAKECLKALVLEKVKQRGQSR